MVSEDEQERKEGDSDDSSTSNSASELLRSELSLGHCFAARQHLPPRTIKKGERRQMYFKVRNNDGSISNKLACKLRACAIVSGHPRCSKDRSLRVQTMAKRLAAMPNSEELQSLFSAASL